MSLKEFLRAATPDERSKVADEAGTSVAYLYQLAGGHRQQPSVTLAVKLQNATVKARKQNPVLPIVTVESFVSL